MVIPVAHQIKNMGKTIAMMKTITHRQRQLIVILLLPTLVTTKPELPNRAQMLRVKLPVVNMSQGGKDPFEGTTSNDLGRTGQNTSDKLNQLIKDKVPPHQRIVSPTPYSVAPAKRHDTGNASVSLGVQMATGLRQSLHGLLQGVRAVRRTHRETGRKLDSRLVTSAMLGNTRLFKHKSKAVDVSSAFTILLDSSGSMSRSVKRLKPLLYQCCMRSMVFRGNYLGIPFPTRRT